MIFWHLIPAIKKGKNLKKTTYEAYVPVKFVLKWTPNSWKKKYPRKDPAWVTYEYPLLK
jgi:hypothetical protein